MTLKKITDKIYANLDAQNNLREHIIGEIRKILKATREAIAAIHRSDFEKAETSIKESQSILSAIVAQLSKLTLLPVFGSIHNAEGELAEAMLLFAFRKETELPRPNYIGVSELGYLLGLGDFVGELRRVAIDALKDGDLSLANRAFEIMEKVYAILLTFDFPKRLIPGVRKKTDTARGLVERTRAEISTEIQRRRLIQSLEELKNNLKGS